MLQIRSFHQFYQFIYQFNQFDQPNQFISNSDKESLNTNINGDLILDNILDIISSDDDRPSSTIVQFAQSNIITDPKNNLSSISIQTNLSKKSLILN